jgi:hypothetical protein
MEAKRAQTPAPLRRENERSVKPPYSSAGDPVVIATPPGKGSADQRLVTGDGDIHFFFARSSSGI